MRNHPADIVLKKLRIKIWMQKTLDHIIIGLLVSAIASLLFMLFIHFYPIVFAARKALYVILIISTIFTFTSLFKKPSMIEAAAIGDGLGLEDRLITYIEYKEDDSSIVEVFKEDLEYMIKDNPILSRYKLKINFKNLFIAILIVSLSWTSYLLPSRARELAKERQSINTELREEAKKIKGLRESETATSLDDEIQRELNDRLKALEKKLEKTYSFNEAAADISEGQREIVKLMDANRSKIMEGLWGDLEGSSLNQRKLEKNLLSENINNSVKLNDSTILSRSEQEKILDDLKKELDTPYSLNTKKNLEKIRSKFEGRSFTPEEFSEVLKSSENQENIENVKEDALVKLQEAKERLMAQGKKSMENEGGHQNLSVFVEGEGSEYGRGEASRDSGKKQFSGGVGNKPLKSSDGIGGGNQRAYGEGDKESVFGDMAKNNESTRLGEEEGNLSQIYGKDNELGVFTHSESNGILAVDGETKDFDNALAEFEKEGTNYLLKYEIPLHRKGLIMKYFEQLNGGKTDGYGEY